MAIGRGARLLPEDFTIGSLGDSHGDKPDQSAALAVAEAFLASVVTGTIDRKLLAAESEDAVSDTIAYGLQQGYVPQSFRIGVAKSLDNGEIAANVRLFGKDGTSEGEIYMTKAATQWLVSDLQLSLAQLAVKREKPKEKFFPAAYRWLLED